MKNKIFRILETIYFCIFINIMLTKNVRAYIDPSVMTYTIQAVAGIAIAIGAALSIYFRRVKKKLGNKLNIDENKNKEVESDEIVIKKASQEK